MIINVTQEDIDNGEDGKSTRCPIALAVNRFFDYKGNASVGQFMIRVSGIEKDYKLTKNCERFISRFDDHKMVHPFHFRLLEYKHVQSN